MVNPSQHDVRAAIQHLIRFDIQHLMCCIADDEALLSNFPPVSCYYMITVLSYAQTREQLYH